MSQLTDKTALSTINAHKKKINWGDVPAIYSMVASSASDLDELLTHGFESGFKSILDKENWNLDKLCGSKDEFGNITVKIKPKIMLKHVYDEIGYELHCYPIIKGDVVYHPLSDSEDCPFKEWLPLSMRQLFRVNKLPDFIINTINKGDEADQALIKHIYLRVKVLMEIIEESFDVVNIKGYSIAEFVAEVMKKQGKPPSDTF
jgi:hypothetical protein